MIGGGRPNRGGRRAPASSPGLRALPRRLRPPPPRHALMSRPHPRPGQPRRAAPRTSRACARWRPTRRCWRWSRPTPTATASPRVLPALDDADGLALVELDAAVQLRAAHYTRRILLLEGFFDRRRAAGARGPPPGDRRAPRGAGAHARDGQPRAAARGVRQGQHRDEPPRRSPAAAVRTLVERLSHCDAVADDPADDAFRAGRRGRRHRRTAARCSTTACKGLPYPRSVANSAGVIRHAEIGGDIVRPGIMLYGATPFAVRLGRDARRAPVMTLRSALIAVQELQPGDAVGYGAAYVAGGRTGSASSPAATPTATRATRPTARRCSSAAGASRIAGRVSMDMITVDLVRRAGGARRQSGRALGRGPAGRRRGQGGVDGRLRTAVRGRAAGAVRRHRGRPDRPRDS